MPTKKILNLLVKKIPTSLLLFIGAVIVLIVLITDPRSLPELLPSQEGRVLSKTIEIIDNALEPSSSLTSTEEVLVTRVVDGDTIEIEGGDRVRYIGVDTPESTHPSKPVECFAKEATKRNKELVEGKNVILEKDVNNTDRYGRLLRYVYIDGEMVNKTLVAEGYAQAAAFPPDVKHQSIFDQEQRIAVEQNKGLWGDVCLNL